MQWPLLAVECTIKPGMFLFIERRFMGKSSRDLFYYELALCCSLHFMHEGISFAAVCMLCMKWHET